MKTTTIKILGTLSGLALLSGCESTQPIELAFGINGNTSDFKNSSIFDGSDSSSGTGFSVKGQYDPGQKDKIVYSFGYQQIGDTEFDGTYMGVDDVGTIETEMITADVTYRYPFTDKFSAGGRLGAAAVDVDERELFGGVPERHTASEVVPFGGISLKYRFTDRVAISGDYDRYLDVGKDGETGEGDIDVWGLSLHIGFGGGRDND